MTITRIGLDIAWRLLGKDKSSVENITTIEYILISEYVCPIFGMN